MDNAGGPVIAVAVGGNALLREHEKGTYEEQIRNIEACAEGLAGIIGNGSRLVLIHGNGPQVGLLMQRAENPATPVPPVPLFVHNAETQGQIGHQLMTGLTNRLAGCMGHAAVAAVLTRVVVDPDDPAFLNPAKPVGSFYSREEIERLAAEKGFRYVEDSGRGYRKVVASPRPLEIVEAKLIRDILDTGRSVIAAGGGGLPVVRKRDGTLECVEAVIDKDFSAALLASAVHAGTLVVLTGVERVAVHFNRPGMRLLGTIGVSEARAYQAEGHFPPGSMGPKMAACIDFVEKTGGRAIITTLNRAADALRGACGTVILPDGAAPAASIPGGKPGGQRQDNAGKGIPA